MTIIAQEQQFGTANYQPVPVVLAKGSGCWVWDEDGRKYLDLMSAYSAVSQGHSHPRLVQRLIEQAGRLAIPSRAFYSDKLAPLMARLCALSGLDRMLPMNTGAEAVETAIKAARRWGYQVKGIPADRAEIIVASGNFHGRTTTIIGFSSEPAYRRDFGPFAPGFVEAVFGDVASFAAAITPHTAAILVEPIQGEAGIIIPPAGWLKALRQLCDQHQILLILDEVQSGLGRTGRWFAYQHEDIQPDLLILGKALGGGLLPVSAVLGREAVMGLFTPGSHGSTFGGNPLAAAVALEALDVIRDEQLVERSAVLGAYFADRLRAIGSPVLREIRGRGLWLGLEIDPRFASAHDLCLALAQRGILTKETHDTVLRIAPPLIITRAEIDGAVAVIAALLGDYAPHQTHARPDQSPAKTPHLVMCPPDHYAVSYAINPWMDPEAWAASADTLGRDAKEGWQRLYDTYRSLGAAIEIFPAAPGLPDLVFTANSAVVLDRKVLLARYRHPERQGEEPHGKRFFTALQQAGLIDAIFETPQGVYFEGAGDAYWDAKRGILWAGWGQRSDAATKTTLEQVYGLPTLALELVDPRFYHLDTAFCVLSGGEILYVPAAFSAIGRELLKAVIGPEDLIAVSDEDAAALAANSVSVGRDLVFGHCGTELEQKLNDRGYRIHRVPLGSFGRSGGSAYCLTLRLDNRILPAA